MVDTKVPLSSICHNYNLYITLRCKIVAGQAAHKLADALPADIRESSHGQQSVAPLAALAPQLPAHRAGQSPTADVHPKSLCLTFGGHVTSRGDF